MSGGSTNTFTVPGDVMRNLEARNPQPPVNVSRFPCINSGVSAYHPTRPDARTGLLRADKRGFTGAGDTGPGVCGLRVCTGPGCGPFRGSRGLPLPPGLPRYRFTGPGAGVPPAGGCGPYRGFTGPGAGLPPCRGLRPLSGVYRPGGRVAPLPGVAAPIGGLPARGPGFPLPGVAAPIGGLPARGPGCPLPGGSPACGGTGFGGCACRGSGGAMRVYIRLKCLVLHSKVFGTLTQTFWYLLERIFWYLGV